MSNTEQGAAIYLLNELISIELSSSGKEALVTIKESIELDKSELAALRGEVERLKTDLSKVRDIIASADIDCFGTGTAADCQPWSIRDEVIHNITQAIK